MDKGVVLFNRFLSTPSARRATAIFSSSSYLSLNFYPRPPRGGRPLILATQRGGMLFLSTPSARRATAGRCHQGQQARHFYPRPPRGGRHFGQRHTINRARISIHALREEGDNVLSRMYLALSDFYPRPPRGGRPKQYFFVSQSCLFLSTPSARRATRDFLVIVILELEFLSTPSARRATPKLSMKPTATTISIHALREEGDPKCPLWAPRRVISIHALREEGDSTRWRHRSARSYFYPRPPRGGRLQQPK